MYQRSRIKSNLYIMELFNKVLKVKKILDDIFYGEQFLFKSINKFIYQVKLEGHDISSDVIKCYYDNQAIVQIFKPIIKDDYVRVPIITTRPFNKVYLDTMYLTMNNSVTAFVNIMDLFSKFAYSRMFIIPKKTSSVSSSKAVIAFNDFMEKIKNKSIDSVVTDKGSEFLGEFQQDMINKKIQQDFADTGDKSKTSPIERFNKTLRTMIEKYRVVYGKITQSNLDKIINSYNNSIHSTLKYTPNDVLNDINVERDVYTMYSNKKKDSITYPLVGFVRVRLDRNIFSKVKPIWSTEIYKINKFKDGYYSLDNIEGKFKREDLQLVNKEFLLKPNIKFEKEEEEELKQKVPAVIKEIEKRETRGNRRDYNELQNRYDFI